MTAAEIISRIPEDHRCRHMITYLFDQSPDSVSRDKLMQVGWFSVRTQGPICAYAAFEYWMLQIDAQLRRFGWHVEEHGPFYRVVSNEIQSA